MASEIDSDSSSLSDQDRRHKKLHNNLKKKSGKKHKKDKKKKSHTEKKRSHKDKKPCSNEESVAVQFHEPLLPQIELEKNLNVNEQADTFGPALPPHLLYKNKAAEYNKLAVISPVFPSKILPMEDQTISENLKSHDGISAIIEDKLEYSYGPLPVTNESEMTSAQLELEQRALQLKMAAIDGNSVQTNDQNVREEWMLELPSVGLKSGLAALSNLKRGFHQGKEKPDFSDRSSWTKTPNSGSEKKKLFCSKEKLVAQAQVLYEKQRDAEQEAMAKKHKKKHKRQQSLVELHQKKLRKEERKKAKELKAIGARPERRPFTRDVDLKLNKIDRNQTKQIVDKAKILNTKFSSGHSKYL